MNAKQTLLAIATIAATFAVSPSFAASSMTEFTDHQYTSSKSRAEVVAELKQARAQGQILQGADSAYPVMTTAKSMKSRDDVRKEIIQSSVKSRTVDYAVAM